LLVLRGLHWKVWLRRGAGGIPVTVGGSGRFTV
jgi:hypothetical protein